MRILGIDPGSRLTGYGCIDLLGTTLRHVAHGTLRLSNTGGKAVIPLEERLFLIYEGLTEVIEKTRPKVMVVEKVFFAKNAVSALKLGQARGAVILTGRIHGIAIVEYSPSEVKQAVVGHGQADKDQVAKMVRLLTGCGEFGTSDASDGLALAICHAYAARTVREQGGDYGKALSAASGRRSRRGKSLADSLGLPADQLASGRQIDLRGGRK